nr:unnamed protein product [Callosobruchus chinensis]
MEILPLDKDVSVLLNYCKVCAFFGIAPVYLNEKGKKRLMPNVIFVIRMCLLLMLSGWEIHFRIKKSYYWSKVATTIGCLQSVAEFALVASTYIVTTVRANRWHSFFEELRGFRKLLNTAGPKHNCTGNSKCHNFKVAALLVFYIFLNTWHIYRDLDEDVFTNISFRFFLLNQVIPAVLIQRMLVVVKRRYSVLNKLLCVSSRVMIEDEKSTIKDIKLLKALLKKCYFMVEAFNDIFGWMIFLMSVTTSLSLLNCLLWLFEINIKIHSTTTTAPPVKLPGDDLGFIITIALSCDATEKEGARFTNLCYTIHIKETNKQLKKEFKNLAVISQKIGPKFSAAGFFTINQMFLSSFFFYPNFLCYSLYSV